MSAITIRDLDRSTELDHNAMSAVRGGQGFGPFANVNVNVGVDQNIIQFQSIDVSVLNNNGVIGAGLPTLRFNLHPTQFASNSANLF